MTETTISSFESLFKEHFKALAGFAFKYVHDLDDAKNLVHDAFISVWEKYDSLPSDTNYRSYLYTAVRNKCLNHLRDKIKIVAIEDAEEHLGVEDTSELETQELEREIEFAINSLPEKCKLVFEMSRFEQLKYAEIAQKLDISVKTVEGRMTQALSLLRDNLSQFITIAFLFLNFQGYQSFFVF